ncbi:non-heme iron oxygenase ferredoxin subunit [Pigmentiphaga sp.]|jgi:Ferredoxin subunits of nitrite reductase and ring-hydroxylating dioxygenases|uniref:non-heme iron oxygenase ferredoxin subunit n=1 Tax=Pigmentiphaga sp. TaxID=1977564 RepID=UPI0025FD09A6|nr:non-heme iron oxygenase ferredoxin subunit [Pigmentiphaga sp.]MBX6319827.1 non-heme iron oxygenase ferredoxin subunit [Pigmentiphaga sp.]
MADWIDVAAIDDLPEEEVIGVQVAGKDVALYNVEGEYYATDNFCTHGRARLCDGYLEGYEIECPLHQGKFDVRSGKALCAPLTEDVKTYPLKVEGGRIWLQLG